MLISVYMEIFALLYLLFLLSAGEFRIWRVPMPHIISLETTLYLRIQDGVNPFAIDKGQKTHMVKIIFYTVFTVII